MENRSYKEIAFKNQQDIFEILVIHVVERRLGKLSTHRVP